MPQYKTHVVLNLFFALPLLVGTLYYWLHPTKESLVIFSCSFIYTSLFMSPDMDLADRIKWYSLRGLLSIPFRSYSKVFKHRGLSHSLLLGSLTRIGWLSVFILVIVYLSIGFSLSLDQIIAYVVLYKKELLYCFAGIFSADVVHILTDKLA
jgi:uncharacterized metal-binding protein